MLPVLANAARRRGDAGAHVTPASAREGGSALNRAAQASGPQEHPLEHEEHDDGDDGRDRERSEEHIELGLRRDRWEPD